MIKDPCNVTHNSKADFVHAISPRPMLATAQKKSCGVRTSAAPSWSVAFWPTTWRTSVTSVQSTASTVSESSSMKHYRYGWCDLWVDAFVMLKWSKSYIDSVFEILLFFSSRNMCSDSLKKTGKAKKGRNIVCTGRQNKRVLWLQ